MIKGCLRGFVLGVIIITLVVIFSGGAFVIVSIVKWIINKL